MQEDSVGDDSTISTLPSLLDRHKTSTDATSMVATITTEGSTVGTLLSLVSRDGSRTEATSTVATVPMLVSAGESTTMAADKSWVQDLEDEWRWEGKDQSLGRVYLICDAKAQPWVPAAMVPVEEQEGQQNDAPVECKQPAENKPSKAELASANAG